MRPQARATWNITRCCESVGRLKCTHTYLWQAAEEARVGEAEDPLKVLLSLTFTTACVDRVAWKQVTGESASNLLVGRVLWDRFQLQHAKYELARQGMKRRFKARLRKTRKHAQWEKILLWARSREETRQQAFPKERRQGSKLSPKREDKAASSPQREKTRQQALPNAQQ